MIQLTLRFRDGIGASRPWLRPLVVRVQSALALAGHSISVDGQFGNRTRIALKAFQKAATLPETGTMVPSSWQAMAPQFETLFGSVLAKIAQLMPAFHGDLDWVHAQEGHRGRPYWPGGQSGVTLDPGVDLGHADSQLIETTFRHRLGEDAWAKLLPVLGLQGEVARHALKDHAEIRQIQMSKQMAYEVMPLVAKSYWQAISRRFPRLLETETLPSVQTVLLSLAYNRGPRNRHLQSLQQPIAKGDWGLVSAKVRRMQQRHKLAGIRKRRRLEGHLIGSELEESTMG